MGLFSKTRTKRIIPPQRKFANAMLTREAMRRLSGVEGRGDQLSRQMRRGQALQDVELARRGTFRDLGQSGIEGPGMYARAARTGEGALGQLIQSENRANIERRAGAAPILGTLLRENQPYTKTRKKTGFMEKAAPYMKLAGAMGGGTAYGDMMKQAGTDMEQDFQRGGAKQQFGGTGGTPSAQGQSSGGPPIGSTQPNKPVSAGGPPTASVQTNQQIMGGMKKKKGGLGGLMSMFGGMFGGGKGGGGGMSFGGGK
jgi:hypothetical protein